MKTPHEVYTEIIAAHQELNAIPRNLHLFCPKVSDEDYEDYDNPDVESANISAHEKKTRIENAQHRLALTAWASLILGILEDEADKWLVEWKSRTESFLTRCDVCVRAWQKYKKALHNRFLKYGRPPCHMLSWRSSEANGRTGNSMKTPHISWKADSMTLTRPG